MATLPLIPLPPPFNGKMNLVPANIGIRFTGAHCAANLRHQLGQGGRAKKKKADQIIRGGKLVIRPRLEELGGWVPAGWVIQVRIAGGNGDIAFRILGERYLG